MNENYGLTLIKMPAVEATPAIDIASLLYKDFMTFIQTKRLYSKEEIKEILNV